MNINNIESLCKVKSLSIEAFLDFIDEQTVEWGNEGELEELKIVVTLDEESLSISTTAAMVTKSGEYMSVPESLMPKVKEKVTKFRNNIVDQIEAIIGKNIINVESERIGDC